MAEGNAFETFAAGDAARYRTLARLWAASVTVVTVRPSDLAHPDEHPEVKKLKDLAAAAVLFASLAALVVGLIVFLIK